MHRLVAFLPLAIACGGGPAVAELEEARQTWAEQGADDYVWRVRQSCFCEHVDLIEVEVIAGEVQTATRLPVDEEPIGLDPADHQEWFTVEGMFAIAERALDEADEVTVTYAAEGYPSAVDIDWITNAVDDESSYTGQDYAPIAE